MAIVAHTRIRGLTHKNETLAILNGLRRGDVLLVDLRGTKGSEIKGAHPCVIVSNDTINKHARTLVIVPISSHDGQGTPAEYEVALKAGDGDLEKDCCAIPHQVRTIDRLDDRIIEKWGELSGSSMQQIEEMLMWALSASLIGE